MQSKFLRLRTWHFVLRLLFNPTQRKHIFRWLNSLRKDYLLIYSKPWLCFDAIEFLETFNFQNKNIFEYGSGGSTLYWLGKNAICTSIEHDPIWYARLRQIIPNGAHLDYRLVEPEFNSEFSDENRDFADPTQYLSADYIATKGNFRKYASQIDEFPDESFDVVLIDGRARPSCIQHSASKLKKGGLLILDNSDRDYYTQKTRHILCKFECHNFVGVSAAEPVFSATTVYVKN